MPDANLSKTLTLRRLLAAVTSLFLLWPVANLGQAGFGRGGVFALSLAAIFAAAALVLAVTAITGGTTERPARMQWVLGSGLATALGWGGLQLGMVLFPESNLLGGLGLIFGPIYWIGTIGLLVGEIMVVVAGIRSCYRRSSGH